MNGIILLEDAAGYPTKGVGAAALVHADSLERAARPPFVMTGVALAGLAPCGAHPIWSALRRTRTDS